MIVLAFTIASTLMICGTASAYYVREPLYPSDPLSEIVMRLMYRDVDPPTEHFVDCTQTFLEHAVPEGDFCSCLVPPIDIDYDSDFMGEDALMHGQHMAPYFVWYYDGEIAQEGQDISTAHVFSVTPDPGTHVVTCTATDVDGPSTATDDEVRFTFVIHVLPASAEEDDSDCSDGSSCCSSCSDGVVIPMPSLRQPTVTPQLGSAAGPGAPGGGTNPGNGCRAGQWEVRQSASESNPYYLIHWDEAGKSSVQPLTAGQTFSTFTNTGHISATLNSEKTSVTVTTDAGTGTVPVEVPRFQHFPSSVTDAAGNLTSFTYDQDTGALETVTLPNLAVWQYEHGNAHYPLNITKVTAPDSKYIKVTYVPIGQPGAGEIESVVLGHMVGQSECPDESTLTNYSYYAEDIEHPERNGKLWKVVKTNRSYYYDYDTDPTTNHQLIMVTERPADGNGAFNASRTVYDYNGTDFTSNTVTKVTQKKQVAIPYNWPNATDTDAEDRETTYTFCYDTPYIHQVTEKIGEAATRSTTYSIDDRTGQMTQVVDPDGTITKLHYDVREPSNPPEPLDLTDSRALLSVEVRTPDDQTLLAKEEYTYWYDQYNQCETHWLKTVKDVRGNWTYYQRNPGESGTPGTPGTLWKVDAVKVADGAAYGANGPSAYEWSSEIDPVAEFTYYGLNVNDGLAGHLATRTVHTDSTKDHVVAYKYSESVGGQGRIRLSPTQIIQQYGNQAPYVDSITYVYYDEGGRPLCVEDATKTGESAGRKVWYRYDDRGRPILTIYKTTGGDPTYGINAETGELINSNLDTYSRNYYSCCGLLWTRDPNGNRTYYAYDDVNRPKRVWTDVQAREWPYVQIDAQTGEVTNGLLCPAPYWLAEWDYDSFGDREEVRTRCGPGENDVRTTTYYSDVLGRLTRVDYPGTAVGDSEWGYDIADRLLWEKDGNDDYTLLWYDNHSRLKKVYYDYTGTRQTPIPDPDQQSQYQFASKVEYDYQDNSDLRWKMIEYSDPTTEARRSEYYYDFLGRLDKYYPPTGLLSGHYVDYDYNNLDQETSVKIWSGSGTPAYQVDYDYYKDGSLRNVKALDGSYLSTIANYSYDIVGNPLIVNAPNSFANRTNYSYGENDPRYPLTSILSFETDAYPTLLRGSVSYSARDNSGNPLTIVDQAGPWSFGYDANHRLTSAQPWVVPEQPAGPDYVYDWVGNRLSPPSDPNPMFYNDADQLVYWPGRHGNAEHPGYDYDDAGNLTEVRDSTGTTWEAQYNYKQTGLLNVATYHDKSGAVRSLTNTWDGDGNRIGLNDGTKQWTYVYDPTAGIPAVLVEDDGTGHPVYYVREPGGALVSRFKPGDATCNGAKYYVFDELGSTRLVVSRCQVTSDAYIYGPWGELLSHTTDWPDFQTTDNPYQYVGELGYYTHYMAPELGLLQLGVRFYDPETGRFTQIDPIQDGVNWYAYAGGNPMSWVDPSGLYSASDWWADYKMGAGITMEYIRRGLSWPARATARSITLEPGTPTLVSRNPTLEALARDDELIGEAYARVGSAGRGVRQFMDYTINESAQQAALGAAGKIRMGGLSSCDELRPASGRRGLLPYKRPPAATINSQRAAVQGKLCHSCGASGKMYADHIVPLVEEYYTTGTIDTARMRSIDSVRPQCRSCSCRQGGLLSHRYRR